MTHAKQGLVVALLALAAPRLAAQTPGRAPALAELPVGARSVAMGHAFELSSTDPDAIFHNPASLSAARGLSLGWHAFPGSAAMVSAAAAIEWFGGGAGVGARALHYGSAEGDGLGGGQDRVIAGGAEPVAELAATAGWGRAWRTLRFGAAASVMERRTRGERDALGTLDVGLGARLGRASIGLTAHNVSGQLLAGDEPTLAPQKISVGAGVAALPLGPFDVGAAAAAAQRADGEVEVGAGVEAAWWPVTGRTFLARAGYRRIPEGEARPWTVGAGYWGDVLRLEYARQGYARGGSTHRITLGWRPAP